MYETLASLYDVYMEDIPYKKWLENIEYYLKKYNKSPKTVLDLGCGTGTMTILLKKRGFEVTGLDISAEMLSEASYKTSEDGLDILYTCQDITDFKVLKPYELIVSLCDCFNYITEDADLLRTFKNCFNALEPGGLLIFDINSRHKLKDILGCGTFCRTEDASAFTCENYYDEETDICQYYVNFFTEDDDGRYSRFEEEHFERAYTEGEIKELIEKSGLRLLETADADTLKPLEKNSERIYFITEKTYERTDK